MWMKHAPHFFPWKRVKTELDKLMSLGQSYRGRRLYLLYNPATGRTNGTTSNFFATMTVRPKNIVDRPHRHTGAAINYYFAGSGYSVVEGVKYPWKAGDLMLSAPGWAVHNHASLDEDVYELTVQDSPLNIWMGLAAVAGGAWTSRSSCSAPTRASAPTALPEPPPGAAATLPALICVAPLAFQSRGDDVSLTDRGTLRNA